MKHLDPYDVEIARTIAGVLPKTDDNLENASVLTALVALMFIFGKKINVPRNTLIDNLYVLSVTADAVMEELKNEGVTV